MSDVAPPRARMPPSRAWTLSPRAWALLLSLALLAGCASLPSLEGRSESQAIASAVGTPIHEALAPGLAAHPGLSGFYSLSDGEDAFAARIAMIDAASRALDVQYYIWNDDVTGRLMFDALERAADRGVAVRLLLDDNNTRGLDALLATLDAHPRIEVRLFNPFRQRTLRLLNYVFDFTRINRRMHNKTLTADGAATIVGGRNVGDEYFDAGGDLGFVDLDVVAVGPVVAQVAASFDAYWRSDSAYPVERLLPAPDAAQRERLERAVAAVRDEPAARHYLDKIRDGRVMRDLVAKELPFEWAAASLVVDDPAKALGRARPERMLPSRLERAIGEPPQHEFALVSPYFVPGREGTAMLAGMAGSGVRIRVLTNALESTDVAAVHSGYARRRRALLRSGIELWELKRSASGIRIGPRGSGRSRRGRPDVAATVPEPVAADGEGGRGGLGIGSGSGAGSGSGSGVAGRSDASLHAKAFEIDRERIVIGSFNFDPRSALHNTELGLVIESPAWALRLSRSFDQQIPVNAYRVRIDAHGRLEWTERRADGSEVLYHREPNASIGRKLLVWLLGLLPIERLL